MFVNTTCVLGGEDIPDGLNKKRVGYEEQPCFESDQTNLTLWVILQRLGCNFSIF